MTQTIDKVDKRKEKEEEKKRKRKEDLLSGRKQKRRMRINLIVLCISVFLIIALLIFQRIYVSINGIPTEKDVLESVYHTTNLDQSTVATLKDPNFQLAINADMLKDKIKKDSFEHPVYVMYFKANCSACHDVARTITKISKGKQVDISQVNVLVYKSLIKENDLKSIPTIVKYVDGKEVSRQSGKDADYEKFITKGA